MMPRVDGRKTPCSYDQHGELFPLFLILEHPLFPVCCIGAGTHSECQSQKCLDHQIPGIRPFFHHQDAGVLSQATSICDAAQHLYTD